MREVVFVRTRWFYESYQDFWRLVELSEFPTCYVDEMDLYDPDKIYIVTPMNGEWRPYVDENGSRHVWENLGAHQKAEKILWNLERPGGSGSISKYVVDNRELIEQGYVDRILTSDKWLSMKYPDVFDYMTLGSHEDLGTPGSFEEKEYDLVHLSCYSNPRSILFQDPDKPKKEIEGMTIAPNGWGEIKDNSLKRSKFMLNIHQDGFPIVEPLRFALAAAYGLTIISEDVRSAYPYQSFLMQRRRNQLFEFAKHMTEMYNESMYDNGLVFRNVMTGNYSFRNCVERKFSL